MSAQNYSMTSIDTSGNNSAITYPDKRGTICLPSCHVEVTTIQVSTGSVVFTLYTTANPRNLTTRVNAFAGTIVVTAAGYDVTGTGTAFTTEFAVGDYIRTNGAVTRQIVAIASDTAMTVGTAWGGTESGVAYTRGVRTIGTITVVAADFAVGHRAWCVPTEATPPNTYLGPTEIQPWTNAPYFNFVDGDSFTVTCTTAAATSGDAVPYLSLKLREDNN